MSNPIFSIKTLLLLNFFFTSESINFTFHGFTNTDLDLDGSGIEESRALRLTNTSKSVIGRAFYPTPIPISNHSTSFSTNFVFQINPSSPGGGGYGLGFVLSASRRFPDAAAGHFMGVFNSDNDGNATNRVFMVEFDTVRGHNEEYDAEGNHVGINVNGMNSVHKTAALYLNDVLFLEKAEPIQARIDYDGVNKKVNVTISRFNASAPVGPLLPDVNLDLTEILSSEYMFAGFSAATGEDKASSHYILGWSFCLNGDSVKLNSSQLPVIVQSSKSSPSTSNITTKLKTALIAALSVVLVASVASLMVILIYRRSKGFEVLEEWELDCPHRFPYKDLYTATKGFRESEKIGVGGFGAVYRGVFPSTGGEAAVKKITSNNASQGMREFAAEIECLGKLRHKNLVNLQGWCKHKNELLLVYDYVPNGSLDSLLYKSNSLLTWEQRFDIIKGVASGLLYLHEDWEQVVIHRDVKSSNVLIDRDMSPRLGDFGLARLHDHGKSTHTTRVVGTIGYIAPELSRTGKASASTDVFAYGILLLEIACGRAAVVSEAHRNVILVDWVVECMQKGKIFDAVDARLGSSYVVGEMELVLGLGLLCSHPKKELRPTMRQVVKYLNGDEVLPLFQGLSVDGSRRFDEVTARLLELGLVDRINSSCSDSYSLSICMGVMNSTSFNDAR